MLQFIGKASSKKLRSNATIIWINLSWEQTKLVGDFYQKVSFELIVLKIMQTEVIWIRNLKTIEIESSFMFI